MRCCVCNKEISSWFEDQQGKTYCSEACFRTALPKCSICGKPMEQWTETDDGKKYCGDACYEKTLPRCCVCGKAMEQWTETEDGKNYCSDACYEKILPCCCVCGKPMEQWTETEDGHKYCSDECFIKSLPKCTTCGKPMKSWIETEDAEKYCNDACYEKRHQSYVNEEAISIDIDSPLTPKELSYLTGLDEEECSRFMEISHLNGDEALEAIDIYMQSLNNNIEPPVIILSSLRSANIHSKLASRLGSYNTMRGGVKGYKGFVFEELHAADAASRGTAIKVLGDNSIADFIVVNKDGTKTFVQAKAGYKPGQIDFSQYEGQKIVVNKGNTALVKDARKAGKIVEESNISIKEAENVARAQQLESKITGRSTAPVTATVVSAHNAGLASAKLAAKVGVGFNVGSNIFDVLDGEKSFSEATVDIVTETIKIAGYAYIGGAAFTVAGGAVSVLAGTALGTTVTGTVAIVGTAITSTAVGGAVVGGIGVVTTAVTGAVATVAAAPILPVIGITAVAGFAWKGVKKLFR